MVQKFIGREAELQVFSEALTSQEAELIAVFGRRQKTIFCR
jgi:AAA+ ATPase superfamily predicted ATPase